MYKSKHKEMKKITQIIPYSMGCTEHVRLAVFNPKFKTSGNLINDCTKLCSNCLVRM